MLCMLPVDRIHNPLLPPGKRLIAFIEMSDTLRRIHHRCHLLRLVIPIHAPFLQPVNLLQHPVLRCHTHILKVTQPSLFNKRLNTLRLQQHIKQIRKTFTTQPIRRRRQSKELRLRPLIPHPPIRLRHRMMRLVNDYQ